MSEVMVMVEEAKRTGDWRLAMTVAICLYGRHRRYFQMELVLKEYLRVVKVSGTQALFLKELEKWFEEDVECWKVGGICQEGQA